MVDKRHFDQDLKKFIKANYRDLESRKEIYAVIKLMADDKYVKPKRLQDCLVNYVNDVEGLIDKCMQLTLLSTVIEQAQRSINEQKLHEISKELMDDLYKKLKK